MFIADKEKEKKNTTVLMWLEFKRFVQLHVKAYIYSVPDVIIALFFSKSVAASLKNIYYWPYTLFFLTINV